MNLYERSGQINEILKIPDKISKMETLGQHNWIWDNPEFFGKLGIFVIVAAIFTNKTSFLP